MDNGFTGEMNVNYQTLMHRDGRVEPGVMPTLDWFDEVSKVVDWKGKSVLDVGCAEGMYSVAVQKKGARVVGLDVSPYMVVNAKSLRDEYGLRHPVYESKVESYYPLEVYDILMFSMILHLMDDVQYHFRRLANSVKDLIVCIYRTKNASYTIPDNGKWFPTINEMDVLAIAKGFKKIHHQLLLTQDNEKEIYLSIYRRYKDVKPVITAVIKTNQDFDADWMKRVKTVLTHLSKYIPFMDFISDGDKVKGYATEYINGWDLWGDKPFEHHGQKYPSEGSEHNVFLTSIQKTNIIQMLKDILNTAIRFGVAPSDITRRNILVKGDKCHLIDLDSVEASTQNIVSTELLSFLGLSVEDLLGDEKNV